MGHEERERGRGNGRMIGYERMTEWRVRKQKQEMGTRKEKERKGDKIKR